MARLGLVLVFVVSAVGGADTAEEFAAPVRILAGGVPIAVAGGHAAPCVVDFDRDGKRDLLVGQFFGTTPRTILEGHARFYRNVGTEQHPRFDGFTYLDARVPSG